MIDKWPYIPVIVHICRCCRESGYTRPTLRSDCSSGSLTKLNQLWGKHFDWCLFLSTASFGCGVCTGASRWQGQSPSSARRGASKGRRRRCPSLIKVYGLHSVFSIPAHPFGGLVLQVFFGQFGLMYAGIWLLNQNFEGLSCWYILGAGRFCRLTCWNSELGEDFGWVRQKITWVRTKIWT